MNVLIRNLARSVTQQELEELFKPFGKIKNCTLVLDSKSGKSKGFGFVEMENGRDAVKAIKALNTLRVHGQGIRVKAAGAEG
jgi:RNA recognition motif-containing protein